MSAPVIPEVVPEAVPAETLTPTPPAETPRSYDDLTAQFLAKHQGKETVVPAPDAPAVETPAEVKPEGEAKPEGEVQPEGEVKPVEAESKFRNADGTFAKVMKAKFGDAEMEVPEGLLIPIKRGDTIEYKPLAEVQKEGMLYNDYNKSKQELADQRRAFAAENAAFRAEVQVWKGITKEILDDPAKAMKYRQDPQMANLWADAAEGRIVQARQQAMAEVSQAQSSQEEVTRIRSWAEAMAGEFPGVDPQAVLREYGDYLHAHGEAVKAGRAPEDPEAISMDRLRSYFAHHHSRVAQVVNPLQARLEAMQKELDALKAGKAAEAVKQTVQHAAERGKAPPVIAGHGGVAAGNTGAVTGQNGQKLDMNTAHKEFLKRYQ